MRTTAAREDRPHPLLILWALAIIAVLAFSGARINMSLLTMLFESARPPATFQLPPSDAARNV